MTSGVTRDWDAQGSNVMTSCNIMTSFLGSPRRGLLCFMFGEHKEKDVAAAASWSGYHMPSSSFGGYCWTYKGGGRSMADRSISRHAKHEDEWAVAAAYWSGCQKPSKEEEVRLRRCHTEHEEWVLPQEVAETCVLLKQLMSKNCHSHCYEHACAPATGLTQAPPYSTCFWSGTQNGPLSTLRLRCLWQIHWYSGIQCSSLTVSCLICKGVHQGSAMASVLIAMAQP